MSQRFREQGILRLLRENGCAHGAIFMRFCGDAALLQKLERRPTGTVAFCDAVIPKASQISQDFFADCMLLQERGHFFHRKL